jgi:hypothetical protein
MRCGREGFFVDRRGGDASELWRELDRFLRQTRPGAKKSPRRPFIFAIFAATVLSLSLISFFTLAAIAAGPCEETAYANGQRFCIHVTKIITNPSAGLLATAEPIYIAAYFPLPAVCDTNNPSTCTPETLPSGYQPLCNPCFHGGGVNSFPYHDHVLEGAPGFGNHGTAHAMKGPWILILAAYAPSFSNQVGFTPFKTTADIAAGELAGDFQTINPGAANPFEVNTGVVIIFGVQPLG